MGSYPTSGEDELFNQCVKAGYKKPNMRADQGSTSSSSSQVHTNPAYEKDETTTPQKSGTYKNGTHKTNGDANGVAPSTSGSNSPNNMNNSRSQLLPSKRNKVNSMTNIEN